MTPRPSLPATAARVYNKIIYTVEQENVTHGEVL